jgi:FtsP/CotA-like multicopper oxidase with cupredoxin domain
MMLERLRTAGRDHGYGLRLIAALLVLGSAAIHFAVTPMHLQEFPLYGVFFIVLGAVQVGLAAAIAIVPGRRLFALTALLSIAVVGLWLVSRTTGLPIAPQPWHPEEVGISDVVCSALELVTALVLLRLALRRHAPRARRWWAIALPVAPAGLAVALATTVGASAAIDSMPVAFDVAPGPGGTPVTALTEAPGSEPVDRFTLTAERSLIDGQEAWTYNAGVPGHGTVPGPELRVRQGDRLQVTLINHLPAPTTIHWHGVPGLPDAEDGVAGLTQNAVPPGGVYTYDFVAREVGTYWYHSHQETDSQIPLGLFGALVVEPRTGPTETRDYSVVLHGAGSGVAMNGTTGTLHLAANPGDTVRLRLVDAVAPGMDGTPETPALVGAPYRVVALDGRDLNAPQVLDPERLELGMGQRADLVFTMPASGSVRLLDRELHGQASLLQGFFGGPTTLFGSALIGDGAAPALPALDRLPLLDPRRYGTPAADRVAQGPFDATYPVVLDEGGGFHDGHVQLVHTINGQASPYVPPIVVHEGQVIRLHIVNRTGEYHPMHLHGHTMSVISIDGHPLRGSPIHLDTVLVGPQQTVDVAFLADNPGLWMLHCHVLLHASFGMSMNVDYAGITTPFTMGSRSGNVPE